MKPKWVQENNLPILYEKNKGHAWFGWLDLQIVKSTKCKRLTYQKIVFKKKMHTDPNIHKTGLRRQTFQRKGRQEVDSWKKIPKISAAEWSKKI